MLLFLKRDLQSEACAAELVCAGIPHSKNTQRSANRSKDCRSMQVQWSGYNNKKSFPGRVKENISLLNEKIKMLENTNRYSTR